MGRVVIIPTIGDYTILFNSLFFLSCTVQGGTKFAHGYSVFLGQKMCLQQAIYAYQKAILKFLQIDIGGHARIRRFLIFDCHFHRHPYKAFFRFFDGGLGAIATRADGPGFREKDRKNDVLSRTLQVVRNRFRQKISEATTLFSEFSV